MRAKEFIKEFVSHEELTEIDKMVDALWSRLGIDVKFTRHFLDRLNDERNGKSITPGELIRLFKKEYQLNGQQIADLDPESQAVMTDVITNINLPFVMVGKGDDKELVAKTIMRKPNFKSSGAEYKIR